MKIRNLFYIAGLVGIFLLEFLTTGRMITVLNLSGIGLIIFASFLASSGLSAGKLILAIRSAVSGSVKEGESVDELVFSIRHFENCLLLSGFTFVIYAVVCLLANLASPETIGPNIEFALCSSIYAIAFAKLFLMPLRLRLIKINDCWHEKFSGELLSSLVLLGFPFANYVVIMIVMYSLT